MEISIEKVEKKEKYLHDDLVEDQSIINNGDKHYEKDDFTIFIEDQRILTIYADCCSDHTISNWVDSVKKTYLSKNRSHLIVGVSAGREHYYQNNKNLDQITLCVDSHCLIYDLCGTFNIPTDLRIFLSDPKVFFVGMGMEVIPMRVSRPVEIRSVAEKSLGLMWLGEDSLDDVVKRVLGEGMEVVRPTKKKMSFWIEERRWFWKINEDYVKNTTVDAFLAYKIGMKNFDLIINGFRGLFGFMFQ